jgi:hypothetical protein
LHRGVRPTAAPPVPPKGLLQGFPEWNGRNDQVPRKEGRMESLIVFWLICGLVAGVIGASKSESAGGFVVGALVGFLLGPLGLILVLFLKPTDAAKTRTKAKEGMRECPHCREWMKREASVCPHCQRESPAWVLHEGRLWTKDADGRDIFWDQKTGGWLAH